MREQPGTVQTHRLMALVTDTWSVTTQEPGGIRRWVADNSLADTPEYSWDSPNTWSTARTTMARAAATVAPGRISVSHLRLPPAGGQRPDDGVTGAFWPSGGSRALGSGGSP